MSRIWIAGAMLLCGSTVGLFAQASPAPKPVVGTVTAADAANRTLTLKADDGTETKVKVAGTAKVSQIPVGETTMTNAKPTELSAVSTGDRVVARGPSADGVLNATLIVVMSKSDIAKKQQADQALWATKGVSGIVTAVDKGSNTVTINSRGPEGVKPLKIVVAEKATVKRYAEGSVKYADAVASSVADIEVNDQVRALGAKSEDGASYTAEQVISGAFRNIAATIKSVDAANGILVVTDLDTKKPVNVLVGKDVNLKKLAEMAANMMAAQINGGARGGAGAAGMGMRPNGGAPGAGGPPAGGFPGGGAAMGGPGGGMRRGGDMMGMAIDRSPAITLSELKKDEALILSVSRTKDPSKVVAITILAGVEPILATPANGSRASQLGTWNLDGGAGMMGGGGGGGPQ
ncbi:hypothetical protein [Bryobacter aggregatus]|uniref:hypothetical protein n=1 Tax=Bryobacter aggregatus TaxID=360054 RepID=UPI0012BA61E9|nr:hypothetical protein [Bryobacter aggregatus]